MVNMLTRLQSTRKVSTDGNKEMKTITVYEAYKGDNFVCFIPYKTKGIEIECFKVFNDKSGYYPFIIQHNNGYCLRHSFKRLKDAIDAIKEIIIELKATFPDIVLNDLHFLPKEKALIARDITYRICKENMGIL